MIFAGILGMFENWVIGSVLIGVGGYFCFSRYGVQIDWDKQRIREFSTYFGVKKGKWLDLNIFKGVAVLQSNHIGRGFSRAQVGITFKETFFNVTILDKKHLKKLVIRRFGSNAEAVAFMKQFSELSKIEVVKYAPQLSKQSIERKNRGRK